MMAPQAKPPLAEQLAPRLSKEQKAKPLPFRLCCSEIAGTASQRVLWSRRQREARERAGGDDDGQSKIHTQSESNLWGLENDSLQTTFLILQWNSAFQMVSGGSLTFKHT
uniref:Uncharacterized protein n=1 Tax=Sphaerodactylus townsendi TaxID=933632 RepID=A0ACB8GEW8_9SAUR